MVKRADRIADEIRDIIGGLFQGGVLEDPALKGITITAAKVSPDLQVATLYFRVYKDTQGEIKAASAGLRRASPFFRKKLAEALDLRRVPEVRFFYDESLEKASRIEDLLRQI
ncbi:MAG: 30S ribosome-binding factor RbfA [Oligoflexales bacterium]